jgi:molybdate transport system substrate-binding protein
MPRLLAVLCCLLGLAGCQHQHAADELVVAAASNLTGIFDELAQGFTSQSGIPVRLSYGSTAQLAEQLRNGAPFDVFAAADTKHIDDLIAQGKVIAESRSIYARGQLALWSPKGLATTMEALRTPAVRFISVANPETAPYGRATVEALRKAGLWEQVKHKIVYANNISLAKQFAVSGNADTVFTAYSLVLGAPGSVVLVDPALYAPIEQAIGVSRESARMDAARRFQKYVTGAQGRALLRRNGYLVD